MKLAARIMGAAISIPDFSSISKRAIELPGHVPSKAAEPGGFVSVDSTGLKVYGKTRGTRRNTVSPLPERGASFIWQSMKTTAFLAAT